MPFLSIYLSFFLSLVFFSYPAEVRERVAGRKERERERRTKEKEGRRREKERRRDNNGATERKSVCGLLFKGVDERRYA